MRLGVKLMLKGLFVIGTGLFWLFTHTSADILASMRLGVRLMLIGLFLHMNRALLSYEQGSFDTNAYRTGACLGAHPLASAACAAARPLRLAVMYVCVYVCVCVCAMIWI